MHPDPKITARYYAAHLPKRFTLTPEGEQPFDVKLSEFAVQNDLEPEDLNAIGRMEPGDTMKFGGGAAPLYVLRREA